MRTVFWASLRVHARRYVAAVTAVTIAVAFIVVTNALTSAAKAGMLADLGTSFGDADVVVTGFRNPRDADRALERVQAAVPDAAAAVNGLAFVPLSLDGATLEEQGDVGTVPGPASLRWQEPVRGRLPEAPGEVALDESAAEGYGVRVGDRIELGRGRDTVRATVTGLVASSDGPHAATAYLTWPDLAMMRHSAIALDLLVAGASVGQVDGALSRHYLVETTEDHLVALQAQLTRDIDATAVLLLVFAAVAVFVAVLVIANTFSVLLAQRRRDFALLRCVGATRRQVLRSVRVEAAAVGAGSGLLGLLVGAGLGHALAGVAGRLWPSMPLGEVRLDGQWLLAAWLIGIAVTVAASLLPARSGTRVSPLAALRPDGPVEVRSRAGRVRLGLAVLALWGGSALLALSIREHAVEPMLAGGFVSFVGVLLLSPWLVPAAIRLVGAPVGLLGGVPGRLAASNAVRNPRRTAATATSLLVGVTLITSMVVGMATVRSTVADELDGRFPVDSTLTAVGNGGLDGVAAQVRDLPGVAAVAEVPGAHADVVRGKRVRLTDRTVVAADASAGSVVRGEPVLLDPDPGTAYLAWEQLGGTDLADGDRLTLRADAGREVEVTLRGADGAGSALVVSPTVLDRLGGPDGTRAVWLRAADDVDADDLSGRLTAIARSSGAELGGGLSERAWIDLQLDVLLGAVLGLLGIGVLIAVVGVGATLGLSVLERTREHALLRGLGLTRRQLRASLSVEAVLLAGVAGLLGTALGATYAWVAVRAVVGAAVADVTLVIPWGQVALVAAVAGLAGLAAGVLPSRRATRVAPAEGLTSA